MSTNTTKNDTVQEVDLFSVSKGIGNAVRGVNIFIYRCLRFALRNIIWIIAVMILGGVLGYLLDKKNKGVYNTQIIVAPNFGSTDYLYAKIDQIQSKIKDRDTVFLNKIGIKDAKDLNDIEIKPVIDVFKLVNNSGSEANYRLLELMAQDGDIKKIVAENTTSKNYPYHQITFKTSGKTSADKTITPLLNYLNDNDHFKKIQEQYLKNIEIRLKANDTLISQIDALLKQVSTKSGNQSVYINENPQLNDVLKTKDELISEQGIQRIDLVGLDRVIKDNSVIPNIKDESGLNGKMKLVLPILFLFLFICVMAFVTFYRKQAVKFNTEK